MICTKCKQHREQSEFLKNGRTLKNCKQCRDSVNAWKSENKDRVQKYNRMSSSNRQNQKTTKIVVYGKKTKDEEWVEYESQADAARKLNLHKPNVNKVITGKLSSTGGYIFKTLEKEANKIEVKTWEQIKEENSFIHTQKNQPAAHRVLHTDKEGITGKICCTCSNWKPLTHYNFSKTHWDNLRNDCVSCLSNYRKANLKRISAAYTQYEKQRKLTDPEFKLMKTLRSRLGAALSHQNAYKCTNTLDLTGCSTSFLMKHLESRFKEGMSWSNHGKWHIDHIVPCSSFKLLEVDEQHKCFHYTNLQPLWAFENLSKSNKQ